MIEHRRFVIGETCLDLTADREFMGRAEALIYEARSLIWECTDRDPFFGTTYGPCAPKTYDHKLIRRMCKASQTASVGPMASVAGAVSSHVVEGLMDDGCTFAIADNGGDVALVSDGYAHIGIGGLPGVALRIRSDGLLVGVCSSSGRTGHSISFGSSDLCTVISSDPILADACATRLGNMVSKQDSLSEAVEAIGSLQGVIGCIAIIDDSVAICGDVDIVCACSSAGERGYYGNGPCHTCEHESGHPSVDAEVALHPESDEEQADGGER